MRIIQGTTEFQLKERSAVAVGKFDGLHRGHLCLLSRILEQKSLGLQAVVFTFDPPASVFFGKTDGRELSPLREKRRLFERMGIDCLIEFPLNRESAAISPEDFVEKILVSRMKAAYLAAGEDVSFGARGRGDKKLLVEMGKRLSYRVEIIEKILYEGREISSTYVRSELEQGHMETVAALLGRNYSIAGIVEKGNQLGRKLAMPTVNLYPNEDKLLPPSGVYYSYVHHNGIRYPAITNIGKKPTVNQGNGLSVESYLYHFAEDLYGQEITVELLHYKRPEQRFQDLEALKAQMQEDLGEGREYHGSLTPVDERQELDLTEGT